MTALMGFFFQTSQQRWARIFVDSLKRRPNMKYISDEIEAKATDPQLSDVKEKKASDYGW